MKKILTVGIAIILVACLAVCLAACGEDTGTPNTSTTQPSVSNTVDLGDGSVTDQSNSGGGAIGDAVSDISEGLTDLSENMAQ